MDRPSGSRSLSYCLPPEDLGGNEPSQDLSGFKGTPGLRSPDKTLAQCLKPLSERPVQEVEPKTYISWFYNSVKSVTKASAAFVYDLAETTVHTFKEGWNSLGQGVPEVAKFGAGCAGFGVSLVQAGFAAGNEALESTGYELDKRCISLIPAFLTGAGIKTQGITNSELRHLGTSLMLLYLGGKPDIHLPEGRFQMFIPSSDSVPESELFSHEEGGRAGRSGYRLTISKVHLNDLEPVQVSHSESEHKLHGHERALIKAASLSFEIECIQEGGGEGETPLPTRLSISVDQPELAGDTNLLSLLGESVSRYCYQATKHLPGLPGETQEAESETDNLWENEKTEVHLHSSAVKVKVLQAGNMMDVIDDRAEGNTISLIELNAQHSPNLVSGKTPDKPRVIFNRLELDRLQVGPMQVKAGELNLDEDLNGTLSVTVGARFSDLDQLLSSVPKHIRKVVTGGGAGKHRVGIEVKLDVKAGEIDLNTLSTKGVSDGGVTTLQKAIETGLRRSLESDHTRLRQQSDGEKEVKLHLLPMANLPSGVKRSASDPGPQRGDEKSVLVGKGKIRRVKSLVEVLQSRVTAFKAKTEKLPDALNKKLHGMGSKVTTRKIGVGQTDILKPVPGERGKVSLPALFDELVQAKLEHDRRYDSD